MKKKRSIPLASHCYRFGKTPLATAIMCVLYPVSTFAQQGDGPGIEEIIVTATKRDQSIQDVPQSITAFSTAEIERRGLLNMADIATNLPSISLTSERAGLNELVYRGISAGQSWRLDSQVALYLDEMPMTIATTQLDPRMVDIERVESLPGPQGTLFGSSSQAGTLRVITNKPRFDAFSGDMSAEIKTTEGGEESYDFNGHLNIPVTDNFAVRIVAYTNKEGGYIDNVYSTAPHSACGLGSPCDHDFDQYDIGPFNPEDHNGHLNSATPDNAGLEENDYNDSEMTGGRIAALWNVNEDWSVLTTLMTQDSETTGVWFSDTAIGDYKVARFSEEWRKDKWWVAALTLEGDLGFAQLTNAFGYSERDQTYQFDNTHYEAYHTRLKGQFYSAWKNWYDTYWGYQTFDYNYYDKYDTGYNGSVTRSFQKAERISNEVRLTSTKESRFQWMIGAFYENHKDGWDDQSDAPNLGTTKSWRYTQWRSCDLAAQGYEGAPCPVPANPNNIWYRDVFDRDITQVAAFGEVDIHLTDQLKLTTGLRWFQYDRLAINDRQWPPGFPLEEILLDGESAAIEEGTEQNTAMKLGISWNVTDNHMVYTLFSEGFRLGGNNNSKAVRVNFVPATYEPDKLNNYEVGLKSEWLDNRLQLNATAFYMTWEDIQLSIQSDQLWWLRGQANGGGGRNLGFEVDIDWRATENLRLSGSVYKGDPYYTDDYVTPEGVVEMTAGTSMVGSSADKFTLALDYTFRDVIGGDLWLRYDTYYAGPLFSDLERADQANPNSPDYVEGADYDVDSFTKSNLQVSYERESWSATFFVRNLTNDRANTYTSSGDSWAAEYWGHGAFGDTHNLSRPRTYSVRFTKRF
ncbi:MAG: TonB-dependent receptor [Woeseia sp.]